MQSTHPADPGPTEDGRDACWAPNCVPGETGSRGAAVCGTLVCAPGPVGRASCWSPRGVCVPSAQVHPRGHGLLPSMWRRTGGGAVRFPFLTPARFTLPRFWAPTGRRPKPHRGGLRISEKWGVVDICFWLFFLPLSPGDYSHFLADSSEERRKKHVFSTLLSRICDDFGGALLAPLPFTNLSLSRLEVCWERAPVLITR